MARLQTIYSNTVAAQFRAIIRPSLFGNLSNVEPIIAEQSADALAQWLMQVIQATLEETILKDRKSAVYFALTNGIKITGAGSMSSLRGRIDVYPWLVAHEFGADIRPQQTYLTIPLFYALRPDGSPIFRSANSWSRFGSFMYTQKATGKKFIAYSYNGQLRILYLLVDKVTIPATLGLNAMANSMLPILLGSFFLIYQEAAMDAGIFNLVGLEA